MNACELQGATGHQPLPRARNLDTNPVDVPVWSISLEEIDKACKIIRQQRNCLPGKSELVDHTGSVRHGLLRRISIIRVRL